ncbi:MAG: toll/interleukin-1 receptor domain-containing protein [Gammaproteobacteria bacterium]|nr:toll/interleukin-1 receptor domain-containing protein [Gammaproteobacteria bacterium]
MAYLTKDEARQAARTRLQKSFGSTPTQILREAIRASSTVETFDVFLSHSSEDSEIVLGIREILVGLGLVVYVDWIDDSQLDRGNVTAENADMLRRRMRSSKSLIFLTTKNSVSSRWMPWELGYFDGLRTGFIGLMPIVDHSGASFSGQEYLGLYPLVERLPLTGGGSRFCVVERSGKGYRFLDEFARGQATIRSFSN